MENFAANCPRPLHRYTYVDQVQNEIKSNYHSIAGCKIANEIGKLYDQSDMNSTKNPKCLLALSTVGFFRDFIAPLKRQAHWDNTKPYQSVDWIYRKCEWLTKVYRSARQSNLKYWFFLLPAFVCHGKWKYWTNTRAPMQLCARAHTAICESEGSL